MGKWTISAFSEALFRSRIDAEYHSHEARGLDDYLLKGGINLVPLRLICSRMTSGHTPLRHDLSKGMVPFVTVECVSPLYVDFAGGKRVEDRHYDRELQRVALNKSTVVVTIKRRIGQASPCYQLDGKATVNQDVAVLELKPEWNPGFVAAYLNSSFGQRLADRERTEQMNPYLPVGSLGKLLIPEIDIKKQEEVDQIVRRRFELLSGSSRLYTQAQQLLESELGLDKLEFEKPMGYTARFSELEESRRADAEYFNPELRHFQQRISGKCALCPITDFVSILKFSNPPYSKTGLPIITQKHLGLISPDDYGGQLVTDYAWVQANPLAKIRHFDLLYYSVGAYLGKTNIWLSDDKAVHASFITMLRPFDHQESGFLHVLLNSKYGILQSKCFQSGTSQPYIYPKDIRRFLIPVIPREVRRRIHETVIESFIKGKESKSLLDQAKARVEQLIEEAVAKSGLSPRSSR